MGSSIALHLAQQGMTNVLVLERDLCYSSTSAMLSAGGIRQQFSVPENIMMSKYGASFIKGIDKLEVNGETPNVQFHESGYLFLGRATDHDILRSLYCFWNQHVNYIVALNFLLILC
jgi:glycine/D-amino acid oxidase-like deaminating enzyme